MSYKRVCLKTVVIMLIMGFLVYFANSTSYSSEDSNNAPSIHCKLHKFFAAVFVLAHMNIIYGRWRAIAAGPTKKLSSELSSGRIVFLRSVHLQSRFPVIYMFIPTF